MATKTEMKATESLPDIADIMRLQQHKTTMTIFCDHFLLRSVGK